MFKTYLRLLGFARPIEKYAIPYFFYSLFYAIFNSLTFVLIVPIMNTMFDPDYTFERVTELPPMEFNTEYLTTFFNSSAWAYVETQSNGKTVRGFIPASCISSAADDQDDRLP